MKHRIPLHASLIRVAEWRNSYVYPTFFIVEEVEEWLVANMRGRHKVIAERTGNWHFHDDILNITKNFRPVAAFGQKKEAALFKMRWG